MDGSLHAGVAMTRHVKHRGDQQVAQWELVVHIVERRMLEGGAGGYNLLGSVCGHIGGGERPRGG